MKNNLLNLEEELEETSPSVTLTAIDLKKTLTLEHVFILNAETTVESCI